MNLIVIIVDDIAGGDLLQVRVETLVREQEERVTESATWWRVDENDFLYKDRECDLSWFGVVDRPTQLFYIWIFICWVGGGEPCGHEELSLSGSSIG